MPRLSHWIGAALAMTLLGSVAPLAAQPHPHPKKEAKEAHDARKDAREERREAREATRTGAPDAKEERKEKDYFYREVAYGRFERALDLPEGVDMDSIKATYHDGVLEIKMKAPKEMASKKVPITVH